MEIHQAPEKYERVIHYDEVKELQVRLTVSEFRGIEYLSLRKYYLDFYTEDWMPSKEGVTIPIDFIPNSSNSLKRASLKTLPF